MRATEWARSSRLRLPDSLRRRRSLGPLLPTRLGYQFQVREFIGIRAMPVTGQGMFHGPALDWIVCP